MVRGTAFEEVLSHLLHHKHPKGYLSSIMTSSLLIGSRDEPG
jgi:hypothetical protein